MEQHLKDKITKISIEFAEPFKDTVGEIAGSGWLIVDPLSGYLDYIGYKHKIGQLPATNQHPQVLIMTFSDGTTFIPAGSDLKAIHPNATDWMWIDPPNTKGK